MPGERRYSSSLNALRFLAACVIVFAHLGYYPLVEAGAPKVLLHLIEARSIITSLFFVLSGFLLIETMRDRPTAYWPFLARRLYRLYPIHVFGFLAMVWVLCVGGTAPAPSRLLKDAAAWLTLSQGFFPNRAMAYNTPAWAVTSFALGYLVMPFFRKLGDLSTGFLLALLTLLWASVLAPHLLLLAEFPATFRYAPYDPSTASLQCTNAIVHVHIFPVTRLWEILFGATLAMLARRAAPRGLLVRRLSRDSTVAGLAAAMTIAVVVAWPSNRVFYALVNGFLLPLLALLVVGLWHNRGWVERLLKLETLQLGGRASILMYFLHCPWFALVCLGMAKLTGLEFPETAFPAPLFFPALIDFVLLCFWFQRDYDAFCVQLAAPPREGDVPGRRGLARLHRQPA
ncbi:MAG: acyltransferase family protein [Bryobacteraceae bacterium]|jgi:peptidoglycan/LPS O-acetylase OafA/YrhL